MAAAVNVTPLNGHFLISQKRTGMVFYLTIRLMPENRFYLNVTRQTRRLSVGSSVNMAAFVVNTGETGTERDGFQVFTASVFRGLRSEETGAVKMRQRTEIFSRVKERK